MSVEIYKVGYLFKPTHTEVHFVKSNHGSCGDSYSANFTRELEHAKTFDSVDLARECVYGLLAGVELDDEYEWTPVVTNLEGKITSHDITPMFKVGSEPFKSMYLEKTETN